MGGGDGSKSVVSLTACSMSWGSLRRLAILLAVAGVVLSHILFYSNSGSAFYIRVTSCFLAIFAHQFS